MDFNEEELVEKLLQAHTQEEIDAVFDLIPLTDEEEEKLASMTGDDPEYFFTERQKP